jgi:hypothetical protein
MELTNDIGLTNVTDLIKIKKGHIPKKKEEKKRIYFFFLTYFAI